jgi:hypothetical protein
MDKIKMKKGYFWEGKIILSYPNLKTSASKQQSPKSYGTCAVQLTKFCLFL